MHKEDWIEYFEAINGRLPKPDEIAQALAKGEFIDDVTSLDVVVTQGKKPTISLTSIDEESESSSKYSLKWLWISFVIFVGLVFSICGGYSAWRYYSGNITGTWEVVSIYDSYDKQWVDVSEYSHEKNYKDYHDYIIVNKDKSVQSASYYTYPSYFGDYTYVSSDAYIGAMYKVDQWHKKFELTISKASYKRKLKKVYTDKFGMSSSLAETYIDSVFDNYSDDKQSITYNVKGNILNVTIKNMTSGKVIRKLRYKRLSDSKAASAQLEIKNKKAEFEREYKSKNYYNDTDIDSGYNKDTNAISA